MQAEAAEAIARLVAAQANDLDEPESWSEDDDDQEDDGSGPPASSLQTPGGAAVTILSCSSRSCRRSPGRSPVANGSTASRSAYDLATRIAAGDGDQERLAACTGEELALHLVIDLAEAHLADGIIGPDLDAATGLPDHGSDDEDFDAMRDLLFADHDVLMLFDLSLDGVDDPESEIARVQRTANLHPRDWFAHFVLS